VSTVERCARVKVGDGSGRKSSDHLPGMGQSLAARMAERLPLAGQAGTWDKPDREVRRCIPVRRANPIKAAAARGHHLKTPLGRFASDITEGTNYMMLTAAGDDLVISVSISRVRAKAQS
jgi:hypothetical protein